MTIENGGEQPANDTAVIEQTPDAGQVAQNTEADGGEEELDAEGNPVVRDETEELEWDGKKWVLPKDAATTLKPALLRQSDYTKKTMEVAEERKALVAEREGFKAHTEAQKAHFQTATKLASLDEQLAPYAKMTAQDWMNLHAQDPGLYEQHRINRDAIKEQRETVARAWTEKEQEYARNANREHGERVAKAKAEIAKQIEGWAPGNELDVKLSKYGISKGLSEQDMGELAIRAPVLVKLLNEHRIFSEAAAKQKTQQTFQASQEAKPVTRVGGSGGAAQRTTTNSSGDALSTEEWAKRETERVAKKRQALGRR